MFIDVDVFHQHKDSNNDNDVSNDAHNTSFDSMDIESDLNSSHHNSRPQHPATSKNESNSTENILNPPAKAQVAAFDKHVFWKKGFSNRTSAETFSLPKIPRYKWKPGQQSHENLKTHKQHNSLCSELPFDSLSEEFIECSDASSSSRTPKSANTTSNLMCHRNYPAPLMTNATLASFMASPRSHSSKSSTPAVLESEDGMNEGTTLKDKTAVLEIMKREEEEDAAAYPNIAPQSPRRKNKWTISPRKTKSPTNSSSSPKSKSGLVRKIETLLPPWITARSYCLILLLMFLTAIGSALVYQFSQNGGSLRIPSSTNVGNTGIFESDTDISIGVEDTNVDLSEQNQNSSSDIMQEETDMVPLPPDLEPNKDLSSTHQIIDHPIQYKWKQSSTILSGPVARSLFGHSTSLSLDGTKLVVGLPMVNPSSEDSSIGLVHVYDVSSSNPELEQRIFGQVPGDQFGHSVSLSAHGQWLVMGAQWYFDTNKQKPITFNQGYAQIYHFNKKELIWSSMGDIKGTQLGEWNGYDVAINDDGTRMVISSPEYNGDGGKISTGIVRAYERTSTDVNWNQDSSILSASAQAKHENINANNNNNNNMMMNSWKLLGDPIIGSHTNAYFGTSVSTSSDGSRIAIGSLDEKGFQVIVSIYQLKAKSSSNTSSTNELLDWTWQRIGHIVLDQNDDFNEAKIEQDQMNKSVKVSLSADGNRVAVAGTYSTVNVYEYDESNDNGGNDSIWTLLGSPLRGILPTELSPDDELVQMQSMELSPDGNRLAIAVSILSSSSQNSSKFSNIRGHVRVHEFLDDDELSSSISSLWVRLGTDIEEEISVMAFEQLQQQQHISAKYSLSFSQNGSRLVIGSPMSDANRGQVQILDLVEQS